jgi:hypothetical protein
MMSKRRTSTTRSSGNRHPSRFMDGRGHRLKVRGSRVSGLEACGTLLPDSRPAFLVPQSGNLTYNGLTIKLALPRS